MEAPLTFPIFEVGLAPDLDNSRSINHGGLTGRWRRGDVDGRGGCDEASVTSAGSD